MFGFVYFSLLGFVHDLLLLIVKRSCSINGVNVFVGFLFNLFKIWSAINAYGLIFIANPVLAQIRNCLGFFNFYVPSDPTFGEAISVIKP